MARCSFWGGYLFLALLTGHCIAEDLGKKVESYAIRDGKRIWQEDQFGNRINFEYNTAGQLVNIRQKDGLTTSNIYKNGFLSEQVNESGVSVKFAYDTTGQLIARTTPRGKSTLKYDQYGRIIERSGSGKYQLNFSYTSWGELRKYITTTNSIVQFEFSHIGYPIKRIWANGSTIHYGYDSYGRIVEKLEADRRTTYTYDNRGRIVEEKIVQNGKVLLTRKSYDAEGHLRSISDGKTMVRFTYDAFGRKILEDGPVGSIVSIYDNKGRLNRRNIQFRNSDEKFTITYEYDEYDRIIAVKSPSGCFNYTWDTNNQLVSWNLGDTLVVNTYDKKGRLIRRKYGNTLLAAYNYDQLGRRVEAQHFDVKWKYEYDQHNQLIFAKNSNGDVYSYTYDGVGNRLTSIENDQICMLSYNKANQIMGEDYAYDAWGNMTRSPEGSYLYDMKNRLIEIKRKNGDIVQYEYDSLSQRIAAITNEKDKYEFLMSDMIEYARSNKNFRQYHTIGLDVTHSLSRTAAVGGILATNDISYLYDGNGNVIASVKNGALVNHVSYAPFGRQTIGEKLPFGFCSKPVDAGGLSYYGFRFYDSKIGRWLNIDPILEQGGVNVYGFVNNAPLDFVDIRGLDFNNRGSVGSDTIFAEGGRGGRATVKVTNNIAPDFDGDSCGKCWVKEKTGVFDVDASYISVKEGFNGYMFALPTGSDGKTHMYWNAYVTAAAVAQVETHEKKHLALCQQEYNRHMSAQVSMAKHYAKKTPMRILNCTENCKEKCISELKSKFDWTQKVKDFSSAVKNLNALHDADPTEALIVRQEVTVLSNGDIINHSSKKYCPHD